MESARRATSADLGRLVELLHIAYDTTPEHRGGWLYGHPFRFSAPLERIERLLVSPEHCVLSGLLDDYVVGFAIARVERSEAFSDGPMGVVEELYVEPLARGVGVGESLLDLIVEWCRSQHCVGIDIPALPGDRSAKNMCERSGFTARLLVMHRPLKNTSG